MLRGFFHMQDKPGRLRIENELSLWTNTTNSWSHSSIKKPVSIGTLQYCELVSWKDPKSIKKAALGYKITIFESTGRILTIPTSALDGCSDLRSHIGVFLVLTRLRLSKLSISSLPFERGISSCESIFTSSFIEILWNIFPRVLNKIQLINSLPVMLNIYKCSEYIHIKYSYL